MFEDEDQNICKYGYKTIEFNMEYGFKKYVAWKRIKTDWPTNFK